MSTYGPPASASTQDPRRVALARVADLLDSRFRIPGTRQTFGVDAILGLVPGVGDIAGLVASAAVVSRAVALGARGWTLVGMLLNITLDALVGSIPVAGTIFDVVYKANARNVRLLEHHVVDPETTRTSARQSVLRALLSVVVVTVVVSALLVVGVLLLLEGLF